MTEKKLDPKKDRKFIVRFLNTMTGKWKTHRLDRDGKEIVDPTPIAPPVGYNPQPSMHERIRAMVVQEAARAVINRDSDPQEIPHRELIEQVEYLADDPEDETPLTPYEVERLGALMDRRREQDQAAAMVAAEEARRASLASPPADVADNPSVAPGAAPSQEGGARDGGA